MRSESRVRAHASEPQLNCFNDGIGTSAAHLIVKYLELMFRRDPLIDPYLATGKRGRIVSALDFCINSRMVGFWPVRERLKPSEDAIDRRSESENASNGHAGPQRVATARTASTVQHPPFLPQIQTIRNRRQATLRHLLLALKHYAILDMLLQFYYRSDDPNGLGDPHGGPRTIERWSQLPWVFLPSTLRLPIAPFYIAQLAVLMTGWVVYEGLCWPYHTMALLCVGSGQWDVESWEVDFMLSPWAADSMTSLWGRRWHQLFRVSRSSRAGTDRSTNSFSSLL